MANSKRYWKTGGKTTLTRYLKAGVLCTRHTGRYWRKLIPGDAGDHKTFLLAPDRAGPLHTHTVLRLPPFVTLPLRAHLQRLNFEVLIPNSGEWKSGAKLSIYTSTYNSNEFVMLYIINAQIRLKGDTTQLCPTAGRPWSRVQTFHLDWDLYEEIKHRYIKIHFTPSLQSFLYEKTTYVHSPFLLALATFAYKGGYVVLKTSIVGATRPGIQVLLFVVKNEPAWSHLIDSTHGSKHVSVSKEAAFAALRNGSMLCLLYQTVQWWSG